MEQKPVGQNALYQMLAMKGPLPHTLSCISRRGGRRTIERLDLTEEFYPARATLPEDTLRENLRFALKNEPLDLRVIHAALSAMGPQEIIIWVQSEPTGIYSRLAWFFYERFVGKIPDLPDAENAPYVNALNAARHYAASAKRSPRHRVNDNLLGDENLCPILRRTRTLENAESRRLSDRARVIAEQYPLPMLNRAVDYLYTRETRSSFDIEGETINSTREERFLQVLRKAATFDMQSKDAYIDLQNAIVDESFAAGDWRTEQVYVSTRKTRGREYVHYICPKQSDVPALMDGLFCVARRLEQTPAFDAVLAAALVSFGFVFIHPFDDGNGRIHRYLIHTLLARRGFTPPQIIFPVSAAIARELNQYYQTLDAFSGPIKSCIAWEFYGDDEIKVLNETRDLYRFWDATPFAEYLYDRVENTIAVDFQQELEYLSRYDAAFDAVQAIADMPDKDIALMVKFCLQNEGVLSNNKRDRFPKLRGEQIAQMEVAIQQIMRGTVRPA